MSKLKTGTTLFGCALALAVTLAGCMEAPVQVTRDAVPDPSTGTKTVSVAGQKVVIGPAAGYCISDRQSKDTRAGAFVVMAPCPGPDAGAAKGLVLINVLAAKALQDALEADEMDAFFKSEEGRSALSSKGRGEDMEILGTMGDKGAYIVHSRDRTGPVIPDTSDEQWRMFFVVAERLVSISIVNFTDAPLSDGEIFARMKKIAARIRQLNG